MPPSVGDCKGFLVPLQILKEPSVQMQIQIQDYSPITSPP
eukprot:CAMPEP_0113972602 /NCGR_PEP_ID=MMETSP0011_2-20120614/13614_1 /TAXON_ID=101924 /ORGANISM="Rhodosorus marinus" /LENGTH=39 /DNA_ID=CAMNT_0000989689 /DNA_START=259 /DNA_END=374 /DNA_ORIENTATION=+ /assembly_acc=CAM_ASM_000156